MKILNLLETGQAGGIEVLCKNIVLNSKQDNRICFLEKKGEIYEELKRKNQKIFTTIELKKNIFKIVKKIERYCKSENIEVIVLHHEGIFCELIYLLLMNKLKDVRFIRYRHSCFDKYSYENNGNIFKRYIAKKITNKALNKSNLIIFVSKAVKESFNNNFKIKTKQKIIYNGIPKEFLNNYIDKVNRDEINISFVGRLTKVKGINLLVDAFKDVHKNINGTRLIITGDGDEKENLKKIVKYLNLDNFVKFTGRKENVIPILDKTDIFVYPSICEEAFGISVVEAMARGCIPITFDKGGLPEIINNNVNGFIVEKDNSEELAKKINYVIEIIKNDKKRAKEISKNAIETAKRFLIEDTIKNIDEVIEDLIKEK